MAPPLAGIRVLDLAPLGPGLHCSQVLSDLGADVIKIEPPVGLSFRKQGEPLKLPTENDMRRNSRTLGLNLKTDSGREAFFKLAAASDVLIEGYRPGVVKRLGVDYEAVRAVNPRIVYGSLSGYGQDGPYASFPGHDLNYQAIAGLVSMTGPRNGPPAIPGSTTADSVGGGLNAVINVLAALFARERTGEGQYIESAMLDGLVTMLFLNIDEHLTTGHVPRRGETMLTGEYPWYNIYETQDGKYLTVGAIEPWFYENLCRQLGHEDYAEHQYAEGAKRDEIFEAFRAIFRTKARDQWVSELMPADTCVAPVLDIDEVAADPQIRHRKLIIEDAQGRSQVGAMVKLSRTPAVVAERRAGGDDTEAILREFGYDDAGVDALRQAGAIA